MARSAPLRRAEQLLLDQVTDRVCGRDVDLLDQRGLLGRYRQHEVAQRVHRCRRVLGEADGDEAKLACRFERGDHVRRLARRRDR